MVQQQALDNRPVELQWHQENSPRWQAEQRIACDALRDVECRIEGFKAQIDGTFDVRSTHGYIYESVRIRIRYPDGFPASKAPPTVFLLSHRDIWKPIADAHINRDWSLCLYVPGESGIDFTADDSLNALFAVIQTFLFKEWQFQKALAKKQLTKADAVWLGPARSHGLPGVCEALGEMPKVGRNAPCLCGSGRKFKHCCIRLR